MRFSPRRRSPTSRWLLDLVSSTPVVLVFGTALFRGTGVGVNRSGCASQIHFILLFADDWGWGDFGRHPEAETPDFGSLVACATLVRNVSFAISVPSRRLNDATAWVPNFTKDYVFLGATTVTNVLRNAVT